MDQIDVMYDEHETTATRFVGFVGQCSRFDLAITTTQHFYGKRLVICLQTERSAILSADESEDPAYLADAFRVSLEEAKEMGEFLSANL